MDELYVQHTVLFFKVKKRKTKGYNRKTDDGAPLIHDFDFVLFVIGMDSCMQKIIICKQNMSRT